jgi:hypothetical protein
MRWFDDLQRMSTSPANAVASRIARQEVDIEAELPRITAPNVVLQALGDQSTTFENAVEVSARSRAPASSPCRVGTTSCSPTSPRGGSSSTR